MPLKRTTRKESFALRAGARDPSRLGQVAQEVVTLLGEGSLSAPRGASTRRRCGRAGEGVALPRHTSVRVMRGD